LPESIFTFTDDSNLTNSDGNGSILLKLNSTTQSQPDSNNFPLFRLICHGYLVNIIGVLGTIGNVLAILVLNRPRMKSSMNYFLSTLAVWDTVLLILSFLFFGIPELCRNYNTCHSYLYTILPLSYQYLYPIRCLGKVLCLSGTYT
jgi:hypothetical protein